MSKKQYMYLKEPHDLYGVQGRTINKSIFDDLPKEHKKLFVTERTFARNYRNDKDSWRNPFGDDVVQHIDDFDEEEAIELGF